MMDFPDGISKAHLSQTSERSRPMAWLVAFLLAALLLAAMTGVLGGGPSPTASSDASRANLSVKVPRILRNGEFFEMRVRVEARRSISKPTLLIASSYWRDLTINTLEPAPKSEGFDDRSVEFVFDALEPGDTLEFKIDGQISPPLLGGTEGTLELRDDHQLLASIPLELTVLP